MHSNFKKNQHVLGGFLNVFRVDRRERGQREWEQRAGCVEELLPLLNQLRPTAPRTNSLDPNLKRWYLPDSAVTTCPCSGLISD